MGGEIISPPILLVRPHAATATLAATEETFYSFHDGTSYMLAPIAWPDMALRPIVIDLVVIVVHMLLTGRGWTIVRLAWPTHQRTVHA